jgi:hypothetical protein
LALAGRFDFDQRPTTQVNLEHRNSTCPIGIAVP